MGALRVGELDARQEPPSAGAGNRMVRDCYPHTLRAHPCAALFVTAGGGPVRPGVPAFRDARDLLSTLCNAFA